MPDTPARPTLAASLACFRDGAVLIARRGRAPNEGLWSLPGGGVEFGETAAEAAAREFHEETGAKAAVIGLADVIEVFSHDPGGALQRHAVVLAFAGRLAQGEAPRATVEADEIAWARPEDLCGYDTTEGLAGVVAKAAEIVQAAEIAA